MRLALVPGGPGEDPCHRRHGQALGRAGAEQAVSREPCHRHVTDTLVDADEVADDVEAGDRALPVRVGGRIGLVDGRQPVEVAVARARRPSTVDAHSPNGTSRSSVTFTGHHPRHQQAVCRWARPRADGDIAGGGGPHPRVASAQLGAREPFGGDLAPGAG